MWPTTSVREPSATRAAKACTDRGPMSGQPGGSERVPWQANARAVAQRLGADPRYVRRLRWLHKADAVRRNGGRLRDHLGFVVWDPEPDNFTFDIANLDDLAAWVAEVTGCPSDVARGRVGEPASDPELRDRLRQATGAHRLWTKAEPPFGKRLGWYAVARTLTPRLIVETGVHDGLGSLLLLRALERNAADGAPGRLVSFDVNPAAGWLVGSHPCWEMRIESSAVGLAGVLRAEPGLDLYVYDGWHDRDAERRDLEVALDHLAPTGVLISDDAQTTHALAELAADRSLCYAEFHEVPVNHFHPGATLGAARRRPAGV